MTMKKLISLGFILGTVMTSLVLTNIVKVSAEPLTSQEKIQAKIDSQPTTVNAAVAMFLDETPAWTNEYLTNMGTDDTLVLSDGHGFLCLPSNGDGQSGAVTDLNGKIIRPSENIKYDVNASTVGQIKVAYQEALSNNYKQYYPAATYE